MIWQLWRAAALGVAVLALGLLIGNAATPSATKGFTSVLVPGPDDLRFRVVAVAPGRDVRPDLRAGDVISLHDRGIAEHLRYARQRVGDAFVFDRQGGPPVTVRIVRGPDRPVAYVYLGIALAFLAIGAVLALRRPQVREVRALASMLLLFSVTLCAGPQSWMPVGLVAVMLVEASIAQFAALGFAVHLATVFPDPNAGGWLARIRRVNVAAGAFIVAIALWIIGSVYLAGRMPPAAVLAIGQYPWLYYLVAVSAAFWIANRRATPADKTRVRWVSLALAVGFSGVLVNIVLIVVAHQSAEWQIFLPLTLLAIPLGLSYAIVRHRAVDIGFVVNRALVFGIVSAIVVVAFMALEWVLGSILVKVSHVTSSSLELGLALLLGFSLRSIHARVDAAVDDVFFRSRHEAERALRTLARDVAHITDPRVAVMRVHAELLARSGAGGVAVYLVDGPAAVRVDPAETAAPDAVGVDDPALVRMRATRAPLPLRDVATALRGDRAFPMLVRDTLSGAIVLAPKTNGEAYAPDEIATIETVALALGSALDALHTAALKTEIARILVDGAPVDALRRTADSAAWVRGVIPQPAGSIAGLSE